MKTIQEVITRLAEIQADIETRGETITAEELANYETEVNSLREQRTALENAAQARRTLLENIAAGRQGVVIDNGQRGSQIQQQSAEDPLATMEYRQAFFEYVRSGNMTQILRDNAVTTTGDISAAVPTTILNEEIGRAHV